jgi:MFS family permease
MIISLTTALWSVAVALCGSAVSFMQLILIRIGVAVGEAGCTPPAFSLIADYFSRSERPRAVAIYGLSFPVALIFGSAWAGWLNQLYGWRLTFIFLGAPGVILAALARFTLQEPRNPKRSGNRVFSPEHRTEPQQASHASLIEVCVALWGNATFRHLLLYFSVQCFFAYGILTWLPAFFVRSYGMQTGAIGTALALSYGLGGLVGNVLGGELASRYAAGKERLQLVAVAITVAVAGILSMVAYLCHNAFVAFTFIGLHSMAVTMGNGPVFATVQTLVPARMRAVSIAFMYLCSNLLGMGLGPLMTGALSDVLHRWTGEESLRYSLLALAAGYIWAGWHAWRASASVTGDLSLAAMVRGTVPSDCIGSDLEVG